MPNINTVKKVKTKYTKAKFKKELPIASDDSSGIDSCSYFFLCSDGRIDHCISEVYPSKGMFGNQKWIGFDNFSYVFFPSRFHRER